MAIDTKIASPIQEELRRRELLTSRTYNNLTIPGASRDATMGDYASKTHYAIMSTNRTDDTKNIAISSGEFSEGTIRAWGLTGEDDGAYRNTAAGSDVGIRPVAGIKSVTVEYKQKSLIRECTVNWVAPSLESLEEYGSFLKVGKEAIVQYGFVGGQTDLDGKESFIYLQNDRIIINQDAFRDTRSRVLRANGNMEAVAGVTSNFSFRLRDDGSFDCTTVIMSTGHNIFSKDFRDDETGGLGSVLPKDIQDKLQQISDGLVPDAPDIVYDTATGLVDTVITFAQDSIDKDKGSEKKSTQVEDNLLNALLNLDSLVDVYMNKNKVPPEYTINQDYTPEEGTIVEDGVVSLEDRPEQTLPGKTQVRERAALKKQIEDQRAVNRENKTTSRPPARTASDILSGANR